MLKNISIKIQLVSVPIVILLSFISLYFSISSSLQKIEDKSQKTSQSNKVIKQMLESRVAEKNYIRRKNTIYADKVINLIDTNLIILQELKNSFSQKQNKKLVNSVSTNIEEYKNLFKKYQSLRDKSLEEEISMIKEAKDIEKIALKVRKIQKEQRDKVLKSRVNLQVIADEIEEASLANKIVKELLTMRISEKNYLRRKDIKYKNKVEQSIKNIYDLSLRTKAILDNQNNKKLMDDIILALKEYKKAFNKFSFLREQSIAILIKMKNEAKESESSLINLRKDQKNEQAHLIKDLKILLTSLFTSIAIGMMIYMLFISSTIEKNLKNITNAAKNLASGNGDLTKRIHIEGSNEVASVAQHINEFIEKVQNAISEAKNVSSEASSISNELSITSLEIGKRVESEALLVESINEDTHITTKEAKYVDNTVNEMYQISENSFEVLNKTTEKINILISTVKNSSLKEEELAQKMQELKNNTNDVKSILELIGDIAEQTNLLSLNAAIEAARAGEHGKGFAVVADEVRKLAERTQKSLFEINATINIVTQAVEEASDNMQENAKDIANAATQASDVDKSIDNVMYLIEKSRNMTLDSSNAVNKLKDRVVDISTTMSKLHDVSISNARSVEEIASAAEHQNDIIEKLNIHLNNFKS